LPPHAYFDGELIPTIAQFCTSGGPAPSAFLLAALMDGGLIVEHPTAAIANPASAHVRQPGLLPNLRTILQLPSLFELFREPLRQAVPETANL
jgi:hypothetical protein